MTEEYNPNAFNELRQAILDRILSDQTMIQEAYFAEQSKFEGSPACVIDVSTNEALWHSTARDRMTFVFEIRTYIPLREPTDAASVEERMGKAYWELLNLFRTRGVLNPHAEFVEPMPSQWYWEERDGGVFRVSQITIRCVVFTPNKPAIETGS